MLSTPGIGRVVADAIRGSDEAELVAVAGRSGDRARAYAAELGISRSFGSYAELLADDGIDAIYIPLPIAMHTERTIRALQAGKHVLCEKPFATTAADAAACFEAAETAARLCIEGLMWRHHPQTQLTQQLVADGAIGRLGQSVPRSASMSRPETSGGPEGWAAAPYWIWAATASARSGCSAASRCASARIRSLIQPRGPTAAICVSPRPSRGDALAQFDVALDFPRRDKLELIGTDGKITIPDPWLCRCG